eukprot:gnl/TRDRNA2_/TRDRNA2_44131_c0_seq1.p1 gnl/TRDRNA2_/TRDRNA2_44131_c0~~gnl/TRDRNA2_/TRDRNA2_44131_c0_seq1.p1  ORF type:complete len:423 (+),score=74.43 gnl/TRDRNA2_/TRDRNA2_44131_c0_seq1:70-1269(+)
MTSDSCVKMKHAPAAASADAQVPPLEAVVAAATAAERGKEPRFAQMRALLVVVLAVAGVALVLAGMMWGLLTLISGHPYLLVISGGFVCLLLAGVCALTTRRGGRGGLLLYLPKDLQDFLVSKTVFDLLHDDAHLINFMRRWMRMLMLTQVNSEGEITALVEGLNPTFVDAVLRRSVAQWLPIGLLRLLLPEGFEIVDGVLRCAVPAPTTRSCGARALNRELTTGLPAVVPNADDTSDLITAREIKTLLDDKNEQKALKIKEPELAALLRPMIMSSVSQLAANCGRLAWQGLQAALALSMAALSASTLYFRWPQIRMATPGMCQRLQLHSSAVLGRMSQRERWASAVGLLGAGAAVAVAAMCRSRSKLREVPSSSGWASTEPEIEESPANSEAAPDYAA